MLQFIDAGVGNELSTVDLARFQFQNSRRIVRHDFEIDAIEIRERVSVLPLGPVILVASELH